MDHSCEAFARRKNGSKPPVLALCALLSCVCVPRAALSNASGPIVSCRIRASNHAGLTILEALARSSEPVAGNYAFSLTSRSASGSNDSLQSGAFALAPAQEQLLSKIAISQSASVHSSATLTVTSRLGSAQCTFPANSPGRT